MSPVDSDAQIIEALRSKDRLWVLKTGEMMEALITERKQCVLSIFRGGGSWCCLVTRCVYNVGSGCTAHLEPLAYASLGPDWT